MWDRRWNTLRASWNPAVLLVSTYARGMCSDARRAWIFVEKHVADVDEGFLIRDHDRVQIRLQVNSMRTAREFPSRMILGMSFQLVRTRNG